MVAIIKDPVSEKYGFFCFSSLKMKMMLLLIMGLVLSLSVPPALAETKTFIKEYTYRAGDEDSRNSCRTIALREVKRLLLEELGTYLESQTEVKNFQMTKDSITTLTAGIVSAEVIEDTWDGKVYWLKAKIAANPQDVIKSIDSLRKDLENVQELEELKKKSEELLQENKRLNIELKIAKGEKKQEAAQAYKRNINNLSATEWLEKGIGLDRSGNYADAIIDISKAIELSPPPPIYATAYIVRGNAYSKLGNKQQAIKDCSKAIELDPQNELAYMCRGLTYGTLSNHQQAIKDFDKAIKLKPQGALTYYMRGRAYNGIGNHQQAIKDFDKAIEMNSQNARDYLNRGLAYYKLGNNQQAIKDCSKAIELNPQDADAYRVRGLAYGKLGNHQQEIKDYDKAIELESGQVKAGQKPPIEKLSQTDWLKQSSTLVKMKDWEGLRDWCLKWEKIDPENVDAWDRLGLAYARLDRYDDAIAAYRQAVSIDPGNGDIWIGLGLAYSKLKRYKDQIDAYRQALRINPENAGVWSGLAFACALSGNRTAALEAIQKLRHLDPKLADSTFNLIVPR